MAKQLEPPLRCFLRLRFAVWFTVVRLSQLADGTTPDCALLVDLRNERCGIWLGGRKKTAHQQSPKVVWETSVDLPNLEYSGKIGWYKN